MATKEPFNPTDEQLTTMEMSREDFDGKSKKEKQELSKQFEEDTSRNLPGGPDAEDALGAKKNVIGPVHDNAPADNSPTTNDVSGDAQENLHNARNEALVNHRAEQDANA